MRLLEMNHIKKSFDGQEVLKDISIHVDEGEVLSIIGPSGSGKSTMLRCATMLETIDDGEIIYLGDKAAFSKDGHAVYAIFYIYVAVWFICFIIHIFISTKII